MEERLANMSKNNPGNEPDEEEAMTPQENCVTVDPVPAITLSLDKKVSVTNCTQLNVRSQPIPGSEIVEIVNVDDVLVLFEPIPDSNFAKVLTPSGNIGFVMRDYIREV